MEINCNLYSSVSNNINAKSNYFYPFQALYFESNKTEDWEREREELDEHTYKLPSDSAADSNPEELEYMKALQKLFNEGEDSRTIDNYKSKVQKMLGLTNDIPVPAERV